MKLSLSLLRVTLLSLYVSLGTKYQFRNLKSLRMLRMLSWRRIKPHHSAYLSKFASSIQIKMNLFTAEEAFSARIFIKWLRKLLPKDELISAHAEVTIFPNLVA